MKSVYISGLTYIMRTGGRTPAGPALAVGGPPMLMAPSHEDQREEKKKGERKREREIKKGRETDKDALYIRGTFVWP